MPDGKADASQKGKEVAIKFFILGGFTWFLSKVYVNLDFLGIYTWSMTGKRQTIRFKKIYYSTLLNQ